MITARSMKLGVCRTCRHITPRTDAPCAVCGATVRLRPPFGLQFVWALWLAGVIAYIPGNLLPIMVTRSVDGELQSTIIGGVITLLHHGSYAVAIVVFVASVMVPVAKFIVIAWLALTIRRGWASNDHRRHQAHEAIEFIGRWSMIDVFVVAALAALIQLGPIASIAPGPGVLPFAVSVALTMLSAQALDPRMIWDKPSDAAAAPTDEPGAIATLQQEGASNG